MNETISQDVQRLQNLRDELKDAVQANDFARVEAALLTPAATITDEWGRTALMEVACWPEKATVDTVRLLLTHSDPLAQDRNGSTPLMQALVHQRIDLAALLLPLSDPKARDRCGSTALITAARRRATEAMAPLLEVSDSKAIDNDGWSALIWAAYHGEAEAVRLLLPVSDAMAVDSEGWSALMRAAANGHAECVGLLLPASDPGAIDVLGWTALMIAAWRGELDCVELLLPVSAPKTRDPQGETALSLAIRESHADHAACADRLAQFSDREDADRALAKLGAAKMPRWVEHLARVEANEIAQEIDRDGAGDSDGGAKREDEGAQTAPVARAKAMRL